MSDYTGILGQLGSAPGRFVLGRIPQNVVAQKLFVYRPTRGFDSAYQYDAEPQPKTSVAPRKDNTEAWQLPLRIPESR